MAARQETNPFILESPPCIAPFGKARDRKIAKRSNAACSPLLKPQGITPSTAERRLEVRQVESHPSQPRLSSTLELEHSAVSPGALFLPNKGLGRNDPEKSAELKGQRTIQMQKGPAG